VKVAFVFVDDTLSRRNVTTAKVQGYYKRVCSEEKVET
jgi:hypothetical protein